MIKAEVYRAQQRAAQDPGAVRVDALARALGFQFQGEEYVKNAPERTLRRLAVKAATPKKRGPYKKTTVANAPVKKVAPATRTARRGAAINAEQWAPIATLAVGERYSMTELMRTRHITRQSLKGRLSTWQYNQRLAGNRGTWHIVNRGWDTFIERIA